MWWSESSSVVAMQCVADDELCSVWLEWLRASVCCCTSNCSTVL